MMNFADLQYAVRLLFKRPGFTGLTVSVMAVGIGLSVYLFSFLNVMAYKDLPFEDSHSLVVLDKVQNGLQFNGGNVDLHDFEEIRANITGLSEMSAFSETSVNVSFKDGARRYNATMVEPNFFHLTRTSPILGRDFVDQDNAKGNQNVAVISYDMWQNQYGGDPKITENSIRIGGEKQQIIGVMPAGYYFPRSSEVWLPMREDANKIQRGKAGNYAGVAHISATSSVEVVTQQINVVMKRLAEKYPKTNGDVGAYVTTFPMSTMGQGGDVFIFSMYSVAILLLLLASVNVGNLLLSRAIERGKETAIRMALGAPRARLISQMLWESIIICTLGGIIGLLIAAWGLEKTSAITATFTDDKPFFWWQFGIDAFTLKIFFSLIIGTILITGLLPAWKNSGTDFNSVLRDGTRGALGKKAGRLNRLLVISEVFLSMTVLIAAGVMVLGTYFASNADYGADTEEVLTARVRLTESTYNTPEKRNLLVKKLQQSLENSPGIGDVAIMSALPGDYTWSPTIAIDGIEYVNQDNLPRANYITTSPGSLAKLGVELISGRYLDNRDDNPEMQTIVVTESFEKRFYPNESAVGKRMRIAEIEDGEFKWLTIVGVVEHTIQSQSFNTSSRRPSFFRPLGQVSRINLIIAMKTLTDDVTAIRSLRASLQSIDSELPAFTIKTYQEKLDRNVAGVGFASKIFLIFSGVAVILAASGIYGVMGNTVNQQTQEIGIKRALGANEKQITGEFLWSSIRQLFWGAIPGTIAGAGLGFALSQLMATGSGTLVSVSILVFAVIAIVVIIATFLPTRRALQMEPSQALRYE